jgi:hypothetical protein
VRTLRSTTTRSCVLISEGHLLGDFYVQRGMYVEGGTPSGEATTCADDTDDAATEQYSDSEVRDDPLPVDWEGMSQPDGFLAQGGVRFYAHGGALTREPDAFYVQCGTPSGELTEVWAAAWPRIAPSRRRKKKRSTSGVEKKPSLGGGTAVQAAAEHAVEPATAAKEAEAEAAGEMREEIEAAAAVEAANEAAAASEALDSAKPCARTLYLQPASSHPSRTVRFVSRAAQQRRRWSWPRRPRQQEPMPSLQA